MFVVTAKIKAAPDAADTLTDMFREMVAWVAQHEPDTITYTCNRATDDPDVFLFFERYVSEDAFRAHSSSEKFVELAAGIQGLVDGAIQIGTYEEIAAKP